MAPGGGLILALRDDKGGVDRLATSDYGLAKTLY